MVPPPGRTCTWLLKALDGWTNTNYIDLIRVEVGRFEFRELGTFSKMRGVHSGDFEPTAVISAPGGIASACKKSLTPCMAERDVPYRGLYSAGSYSIFR